MPRDEDGEPAEVEWLDVEPPPNPPPGARPPRRAWYLLAGAGVVAVVLVLTLSRHHTKRASEPSRTPTPTPTPSSSTSTFVPESSPSPTPPVSVTNLGRPLLHVPASWELFARGPDAVYRIQLAKGRITRTSAPLASNGPVSMVVEPHAVILRPWDNVGGHLIPDGRPARDLPGLLKNGGPALPGPEPNQVWVQTGDQDHPRMVLVGMDGRSTGVSVPAQGYGAMSDGAGYPLLSLVGGVYDSRPDGLHRITTGSVIASGPTGWLTEECDDQHRCTLEVTDRHSGTHRALGPARDNEYGSGAISPDGTTAALVTQPGTTTDPTLYLIDLGTGAVRRTAVTLNTEMLGDATIWSPDSRWLFVADSAGHLLAVDRSGHPTTIRTGLPAISQLAIR